MGRDDVYLTQQGYEKLCNELEFLKNTRRREISKAIEQARLQGDISENAEFDAAKDAQALNEQKIAELEGFTETPRMVWNEFSPESLTGKIDRMVKEVQVGLLVPDDELQGVVRRWEKLPVVVTTREELKEGEKNTTTERPKKG